MMHKEDTEESEMEGEENCWEHISEDKKKAFMKVKLDFKIKKVQAKLDFLKELQKIFEKCLRSRSFEHRDTSVP